jgi:hypothetical protein
MLTVESQIGSRASLLWWISTASMLTTEVPAGLRAACPTSWTSRSCRLAVLSPDTKMPSWPPMISTSKISASPETTNTATAAVLASWARMFMDES